MFAKYVQILIMYLKPTLLTQAKLSNFFNMQIWHNSEAYLDIGPAKYLLCPATKNAEPI